MEKKTEGKTPYTSTQETETENLRKALADERVKNEALSRRCIRLGEALDAALRAEDNRVEKRMFGIINRNCYRKIALEENRKAMLAERKRRIAHDKQAAAAYEKACHRNATALCGSAVIGFSAVIFGFAGFIHTALAATIAGVALMAFGWSLNTCVYLLGRCE